MPRRWRRAAAPTIRASAAAIFRDVVFDEDVPTRYRVGDRIRLSGVVNARDRTDIDQNRDSAVEERRHVQ
jgi:hypothetical protein